MFFSREFEIVFCSSNLSPRNSKRRLSTNKIISSKAVRHCTPISHPLCGKNFKTAHSGRKRSRSDHSTPLRMSSSAGDNVTALLHKSLCCCLNEDLRAPHTNLFVGDHTLPLRSDADEQLLLHLGFNQTMKLSSIILGVPDNSSCPKTLKLFCNQTNLGFDDATGTNKFNSSQSS